MDERTVEVEGFDSALETRCKHLQISPRPACKILALVNIVPGVIGKYVLFLCP